MQTSCKRIESSVRPVRTFQLNFLQLLCVLFMQFSVFCQVLLFLLFGENRERENVANGNLNKQNIVEIKKMQLKIGFC